MLLRLRLLPLTDEQIRCFYLVNLHDLVLKEQLHPSNSFSHMDFFVSLDVHRVGDIVKTLNRKDQQLVLCVPKSKELVHEADCSFFFSALFDLDLPKEGVLAVGLEELIVLGDVDAFFVCEGVVVVLSFVSFDQGLLFIVEVDLVIEEVVLGALVHSLVDSVEGFLSVFFEAFFFFDCIFRLIVFVGVLGLVVEVLPSNSDFIFIRIWLVVLLINFALLPLFGFLVLFRLFLVLL